MSVTTGRGDEGETDLLFGRRVPKSDPRVAAIGAVDEFNAALGLARVAGVPGDLEELIDGIQGILIGLMGELATLPEDRERYREAGYPEVGEKDVEALTTRVHELEAAGAVTSGWARPGASGNEASARLDFARTVCRRAERELLCLGEAVANPFAARYLNRASDLMWVLARSVETSPAG